MDPSSLAPALQLQHGDHYYREVNRLREVLRDKLTTAYRLEVNAALARATVHETLIVEVSHNASKAEETEE